MFFVFYTNRPAFLEELQHLHFTKTGQILHPSTGFPPGGCLAHQTKRGCIELYKTHVGVWTSRPASIHVVEVEIFRVYSETQKKTPEQIAWLSTHKAPSKQPKP